MLDLLIQNGLIFDGLSSASMREDIGIKKGKIVAMALAACQGIASSLPPNASRYFSQSGNAFP